jgi:hypothetical protein
MTELERRIRELTQPLNGQYPRPWMSDSTAPGASRVFLIGRNPATELPAGIVDHDAYLDALFNRNGRSIRKLYDEVHDGGKSDTRPNIDWVAAKLKAKGIANVLQTNVVCYATRKFKDLRLPKHEGGKARGRKIFEALLDEIRPPVLLAHGVGTRDELAEALRCALPYPPQKKEEGIRLQRIETKIGGRGYRANVFVIPSLGLPGWSTWPERQRPKWHEWACSHIEMVCESIHQAL